MSLHSKELVREISVKAQMARIRVLRMVFEAESGHIGGAFSSAEIVASLYFHHLRIDPLHPYWPKRDRFLLSKGHACALLYAILADRGFFPVQELATFRRLDSRLQGHPDRLRLPGVEISAGPLGHGIAVGVGIALALFSAGNMSTSTNGPFARPSGPKVYVLLGDGELDAGVVWEGALLASKYRLGNLTAIIDCNGFQQSGATSDVLPIEPLADKWNAFGWEVQRIDGHSVLEILDSLDRADRMRACPRVIIARTTKGKGVSFMENNYLWHGTPPTPDQYQAALRELEKGLQTWRN